MNYQFSSSDISKVSADAVVVPTYSDDFRNARASSPYNEVNKKLRGHLGNTATAEGFQATAGQTFVMHVKGSIAAHRVVLIGLGSRASGTIEGFRLACGSTIRILNKNRLRHIVLALPTRDSLGSWVQAAVEGLELGAYRFFRWRTTNRDEQRAARVQKVTFLVEKGAETPAKLNRQVAHGRRLAEATNWARDLVNEPPNELTPARLAEHATEIAEKTGLHVEVRGRTEIEELKMGMFVGVTQGSIAEPKLVKVSYLPKNQEHSARPPVCLVGKAITFDSGGLSLKPADAMVDMKTDMAGSAAVLGAMRVIATVAPPFPVHAFFGACENMPSGTAYRPGDILVSRIGKTVEITNTDAEGRLVLGDVLAWANELKPSAIIDLATLTGACMVALGHYIAGAFSDDEALYAEVSAAAKTTGEELWRLPITPLNKDVLKSDVADMKNSGERFGGATNAALFLKEFVGATPWLHIDIAGPAQSPKERGYNVKGGTGYGVRTLVEFIRQRAEKISVSAQ